MRVDHVDVINESFGVNLYPDNGARNTIQLFNDQAVAAGVTVTVSTGDAGITSTIGNPVHRPAGHLRGAITDSRLYAQTGYAAAPRFRQRQLAGRQHLVAVVGRASPSTAGRSTSRAG